MAAKKKTASKTKSPDPQGAAQDPDGASPNTESSRPEHTGPTLADAATGYLAWLDKHGAGDGTLSSYRMELKLAMRELGEATALADLAPERVADYFASEAVTKTRHGKHKAKATIDKTRRVLRLALVWAQSEGLVEAAPIPASTKGPVKLQAV